MDNSFQNLNTPLAKYVSNILQFYSLLNSKQKMLLLFRAHFIQLTLQIDM